MSENKKNCCFPFAFSKSFSVFVMIIFTVFCTRAFGWKYQYCLGKGVKKELGFGESPKMESGAIINPSSNANQRHRLSSELKMYNWFQSDKLKLTVHQRKSRILKLSFSSKTFLRRKCVKVTIYSSSLAFSIEYLVFAAKRLYSLQLPIVSNLLVVVWRPILPYLPTKQFNLNNATISGKLIFSLHL